VDERGDVDKDLLEAVNDGSNMYINRLLRQISEGTHIASVDTIKKAVEHMQKQRFGVPDLSNVLPPEEEEEVPPQDIEKDLREAVNDGSNMFITRMLWDIIDGKSTASAELIAEAEAVLTKNHVTVPKSRMSDDAKAGSKEEMEAELKEESERLKEYEKNHVKYVKQRMSNQAASEKKKLDASKKKVDQLKKQISYLQYK